MSGSAEAGVERKESGRGRRRVYRLLSRLIALLDRMCIDGITAVDPAVSGGLKILLEIAASARLRRIHARLERLRFLVSSSLVEEDDSKVIEAAGIVADLVYTAKAVKTYYAGRLEDERALPLLFKGYRPASEYLDKAPMFCVGVDFEYAVHAERRARYVLYLLHMDRRCLCRVRSAVLAPSSLSSSRVLSFEVSGNLYEGFPPRRLGGGVTLARSELLDPQQGRRWWEELFEGMPSSLERLIRIYLAYRNNYFAPSGFWTFFRPRSLVFDSGRVFAEDATSRAVELERATPCGWLSRMDEVLSSCGSDGALFGRLDVRAHRLVFRPVSYLVRGEPFRCRMLGFD